LGSRKDGRRRRFYVSRIVVETGLLNEGGNDIKQDFVHAMEMWKPIPK
jgi:hypothetical protein